MKLHDQPYETVDEDFLQGTTMTNTADDVKAWLKGVYVFEYPKDGRLATIQLHIDWNRFDDPYKPKCKWVIYAPQSLYYPGWHSGEIRFTKLNELLPLILGRFQVIWSSPIFLPFLYAGGFMSSVGPLEDIKILQGFTSILECLAHVAAFGPFVEPGQNPQRPFDWHYGDFDIMPYGGRDRNTFLRAASFFARAYTQPLPDEGNFQGVGFSAECRETSTKAIRELLNFYRPEILQDANSSQEWQIEAAYENVHSQRQWALEDRKWADRLVDACDLKFLKLSTDSR
jgi:hypothetical protein